MIPRLAVIDPTLSVTAPKSITAATGMDALTHAVEAYTSKKATPYTDIFAMSAIKRVFAYLPAAYENGADLEARTQMALAAYEAGVCINNASVTLVHGMSRPIGALFHVPHGISNAMLISKCLAFAEDGCISRFAAIGRALGAEGSDQECADAFLYLWKISARRSKFRRWRCMASIKKHSSKRWIRWQMMHWQAAVREIRLKK